MLKNAKENQYIFYKDKKIMGMIMLIMAIGLLIFSFLKIPVLTTVHAYTIGLVFGSFAPFFYAYVIYEALEMIFDKMPTKPRWIKLTKLSYWIVVILIIFTFSTWFHYIETAGVDSFGSKAWSKTFTAWWTTFTKDTDFYAPKNSWGGILGASLFCMFAMLISSIGAGIIAAFSLVVAVSLALTGTTMGLYKNMLSKRRRVLKSKEVESTQTLDLLEEEEIIDNTNEIINNEILPFEDPFSTSEIKLEKKESFKPISSNVLKDVVKKDDIKLKAEIKTNAAKLTELFQTFSVDAKVIKTLVGPTLTKYIIAPGPGVNLKRFAQLESNIKMTLAAKDIRMELPIPGQAAIGVEVPNLNPQMVSFKEVFKYLDIKYKKSPLAVALGKDVQGNPLIIELNKTPHMLVAGATGSGKSVGINSIVMSLIMRTKPEDVQLVLVDPKMVEFLPYKGIPHLYAPIITDPKKAAKALNLLVEEMENRYLKMSQLGVRNLEEYNKKSNEKWPYIVAIIDELADLMNVAAKHVETSIQRITQKARAAGIHLILATQRPSVNVVTGVIKANIPSRIAFAVTSGVDSQVILDAVGAEKLMGRGDMLISLYGQSIQRSQGAFISNEEINDVIKQVKRMGKPNYKILDPADDEE